MSLEASAWRFTCQRQDCPDRTWQGLRSLEVKGTKAAAIKQARAAGWRPCSEVLQFSRRSLASWYCPGCSATLTSRHAAAASISR